MSGIFGILHKAGQPVEATQLYAMQQAMREWGPDGDQLWHEGAIGMGHLFMCTLPQSHQTNSLYSALNENQSFWRGRNSGSHHNHSIVDPSGKPFVITADARIDNRQELCDRLAIPNAVQAEQSDDALILAAYEKWGMNCPQYLVGAYAFAIWDRQTRHLFLARDHIGFRPLHFYNDAKQFLFATDVRALLALDCVPQRLDLEAIAATRAYYVPYQRENSLYIDIKKLSPGQALWVDAHTVKQLTYWHPQDVPQVRLKSNAEYAAQLRVLVQEAVACRLHSPYPIGSHLSGGLDSSAITVLAAQQLRAIDRRLTSAFAWAPAPQPADYPLQDERQYIEEICLREKIACTYVPLSVDDVIAMWLDDMRQKPQVTMYHELPTRQLAAQQGIRVLLSGWGGDEAATAHGQGFLSEQFLRFNFRKLLTELYLAKRVRASTIKGMLRKEVVTPLLPRQLLKRQLTSPLRELLDDPDVSDRMKGYLERFALESKPSPTVSGNLYRPFIDGWHSPRIECWAIHGLRDKIDYRYPLLDRRVIEFCLGLPAHQFVQNGWTRFIFRNAMTGILPDSVCWNPRNKAQSAYVAAMTPTVKVARDHFAAQLNSGEINIAGVSNMWQDRLLPL